MYATTALTIQNARVPTYTRRLADCSLLKIPIAVLQPQRRGAILAAYLNLSRHSSIRANIASQPPALPEL
jgi:hypothetical protein